MRPQTAKAIGALEAYFGPRAVPSDRAIPFWEATLDRRDPDEVARAVELVVRHHTHGMPALRDVVQALDGRWETRKVARTDANLVPSPQTLGYEHLVCLVEYGSGDVLRAFDSNGNLVDFGTQRLISSAETVDPKLLPPASAKASSALLPERNPAR